MRRLLALGVLLGVSSCSLLLSTSADQCAVDADCAHFGPGRSCQQGVCVNPLAPVPCAVNADCTAPKTVCRKSDHLCTGLTTPECPDVFGNYGDDNAVTFGAVLPISFDQAPDYLAGVPATGVAMEDAIALAVADFQNAGGLPPLPGQVAARPVVFVVCTDNHSTESTGEATGHLVNDVGVGAIVGSAYATFTDAVASALPSQNGVLLLTPRSTDLDATKNGGLVWRLSPADAVEASAMSALVAAREAGIKTAYGVAAVRVAVVYKNDAYGQAVVAGLRSSLVFNSGNVTANAAKNDYAEYSYDDPDSPTYYSEFPQTALAVVDFAPELVLVVGTDEAVPLVGLVEANWGAAARAPEYIASDGVATPALVAYVAGADAGATTLATRLLGTMTANADAAFTAYQSAYAKASPTGSSTVYGAAGLYDAAYMLAYSAAALGDLPVTGANLAQGFSQLRQANGALAVDVGPAGIKGALAALPAGQPIALHGVSSPLSFDPTNKIVTGTSTQIWCVPNRGSGAGVVFSGAYVDSTGSLQNPAQISSACGQ
jgi:branched-chain amino acid transport system substrate-binding protein